MNLKIKVCFFFKKIFAFEKLIFDFFFCLFKNFPETSNVPPALIYSKYITRRCTIGFVPHVYVYVLEVYIIPSLPY